MKLTKEQILAFYLPHKLQMKCDGGIFRPNNNERPIIKGADATLTPDLYADICNRTYNSIGTFTPLLRPLSSLTIEQEINGERFVPVHRIFNAENKDIKFRYEEVGRLACIRKLYVYGEHPEFDREEEIGYLSYNWKLMLAHQLMQLLSMHFNVFNLPEDEYVDINSLKK